MIGSLGEESGERREGVEGRVAIIVEMEVVMTRLLFGICVEFRRFVYFLISAKNSP